MLTVGSLAVLIASSALKAVCTEELMRRCFGRMVAYRNGNIIWTPDSLGNDDCPRLAHKARNEVEEGIPRPVATDTPSEPDRSARDAGRGEQGKNPKNQVRLPHYVVQGMSGPAPREDEQKIRDWVTAAAPDRYPEAIILVRQKQYDRLRGSIQHQMLGGRVISPSSGKNGQEHFGGLRPTQIGDGFSIRCVGRIYLNADILQHAGHGKEILFHELGHIAADDASEDKADKFRDVYLKRCKSTEAIWNGIRNLPAGRRDAPLFSPECYLSLN